MSGTGTNNKTSARVNTTEVTVNKTKGITGIRTNQAKIQDERSWKIRQKYGYVPYDSGSRHCLSFPLHSDFNRFLSSSVQLENKAQLKKRLFKFLIFVLVPQVCVPHVLGALIKSRKRYGFQLFLLA